MAQQQRRPVASPADTLWISSLSRREFLVGIGASATAIALAGCGGGNDSAGPGSTQGLGVSRTAVSGTTTDQVNQFSIASEQIGNIWQGDSPALNDLQNFISGSKASRAPVANTRLMYQATWYALQGLRSGYERLLNGVLACDDQGAVAATVSANANLNGNSSLTNPQWLAAMMLQTYSASRVIGALMKILQIAGIKEMQDWVTGQAGDVEKLIAYGILADTYNSWLDGIAKTLGIPALSSSKLDVSSAVTAQTIPQQFAGLPAILAAIPYTPGYRAGGNANGIPDDAMLTGPASSNFALSFLGTLAKITLTTGVIPANFPQTADPTTATYDLTGRLGATGLGTNITALAGTAAAAQTKATTLISQLMNTGLPAADGSAASGLLQMAFGGYALVAALAQAILSEHSIVGAALSGAAALQMLNDEINAIRTVGTAAQNAILNTVLCDIAYLQSTYLVGGNTMVLRNVPVVNIPSAVETDQIRNTLQINCQNQLCYPLANAGWTGKPADRNVPLFRGIVAGLPAPPTGVPRTFNNIEVAGAGLFYDLLFIYADTLKPDFLTSGQFIFCLSDFARLLRRSPGAVTAMIPSITAAVLLCSAPGFVPSKDKAPRDLSKIASLGALSPITDLVPGVPINVQ